MGGKDTRGNGQGFALFGDGIGRLTTEEMKNDE
jgi:hypothetical protein